ncbi:MAG: hypothetical protein QXN67_00765 [Thermoproteota archaeon]
MALTINDKTRIEKLKNTIIHYENKIAEDDKPGLWNFSYDLLIKSKKVPLSDDEEKRIIETLKQRFEKLLKGNNIHAAESAADLLVDYYERRGKLEEAKSILINLGNVIQRNAEQVSALVGAAWLIRLHQLYLRHGLKMRLIKFLLKLKNLEREFQNSGK